LPIFGKSELAVLVTLHTGIKHLMQNCMQDHSPEIQPITYTVF